MKPKLLLFAAALTAFVYSASAQGVLGKIKQKAEQAAEKALDKKAQEKTGTNGGLNSDSNSGSSTNQNNSSSRPTNKGGGGLISTPPDVKQNLTDAEGAFKTNSYGEARYAVQQAMLGVEMEIGNKVLASLPETVIGLKKQPEADRVTSTGWGWVGLTIQREYLNGDKQVRAMVANNAAWMSAVNMYLSNGAYSQQTNGEQKWKQVKVKGYRGVIEYDESSGYKLSIPIGQSSLLVLEGVNIASEQEMMNAGNSFDLDGIKKMLGEK